MSLVELNKLADDTKIYTTIKDTSDPLDFLLQKNLDMVNEWLHKWLLKFNQNADKISWAILALLITIYVIQMNSSDLLSAG